MGSAQSSCIKGKGKKQQQKLKGQSWSELPLDLLDLIINRLYYIDQVRLRAVCKSWRAAKMATRANKLPWLMAYDRRTCYLYDPDSKQSYTVPGSRGEIIFEAYELESKHGWVLFFRKMGELRNGSTLCSLFFYSPFPDRIIELPELNKTGKLGASFSSAPDCPACLVYAMSVESSHVLMRVCQPGSKTWTEYRLPTTHKRINNSVFLDGLLHCSLRHPPGFGVFNVASEKWETRPSKLMYLIVSDGKLWAISPDGYLGFDRPKMEWFRSEMMESRVMFTNGYSCFLVALENRKEFANTYHCFDVFGRYGGFCIKEDESRLMPEYVDFVYNSGTKKMWIQPPLSPERPIIS